MNHSRTPLKVLQDPWPQTVAATGNPVGILATPEGTLRFWLGHHPEHGRALVVEVTGFRTDRGRMLIDQLGHMDDVVSELLFADRAEWGPVDEQNSAEAYGASVFYREFHYRRDSS